MRDFMDCLSLPGPFTRRRFNPATLFRPVSAGVLLAPSRLDTLSQDATGNTPANAPGQPVGLVRDLSGGNRHASQATSAARPTLGRHPRSGRRNLLRWSDDFSDAAWQTFGTVNRTANAALAPDGTMTADRLEIAAASGIYQNILASPLTAYTASIWVRADAPTTTALVSNTNPNNPTFLSIAVTTEWKRVSLSRTTGASASTVNLQLDSTYGANTIYVWRAQLEFGGLTPSQRVTTAFDVTEPGQPDVWYLSTDAIDDFLATAAVEWGSDEVTIVAALRKRSDDADGTILNFGDFGGGGGFMLHARFATTNKFVSSAGSVSLPSIGTTNAAYSAPISVVAAMQAKIDTDTHVLRINGTQVNSTDADQAGAATYGNRQVFVGRRSGTAFAAAMDLYALFVINRLLSPAELAEVERWAAWKMGVTL